MVSALQLIGVAAIAVAAIANPVEAVDEVASLKVGDYYRPTGSIVSGWPSATTAYRRSPCPALNSLANHGYFPRDGKNITYDIIAKAFKEQLNIGDDLIAFFEGFVDDGFDLNYLGTHNFIEHDASLAHIDAYYGQDPMKSSELLTLDLMFRANKGYIDVQAAAETRLARNATCYALNPECGLTASQTHVAYLEAALLIQTLGGKRHNNSISVTDAYSFLVNEKFPSDFVKAADTVYYADMVAVAALMEAITS